MKKFGLAIFLLSGIVFSVNAQYKGTVFLDANANGIQDAGEQGIKAVRVSDGLNVIPTDGDGRFELPGDSITRFVFITVPAGYKTTQKHYLEVASNSEFYNFGLVPFSSTARQARFIQITDTETYEHHAWIENIRDYAAINDVGFVVHTGDICYEKGLKFHANEVNSQTIGVPVFYCIGNHDLVKGEYGEQLFESLFGPVYYSFEAGNTHFIVTPMRYGDHKPSYTQDQVYDWLVNDLTRVDPSMNVVIFNHDLLTFDEDFIFKGSEGEEVNLNEHNLKAWIYGHWHINFLKQHGENGPISVCASTPDKGGIDHSPSNFIVYDVDEEGTVNVKPRYCYVNRHLVVHEPLFRENKELAVSVNTYHSMAETKSVKGVITTKNGKRKSFELIPNSDWNWGGEVPLPRQWRKETLKLELVATFSNGDSAVQKQEFIPASKVATSAPVQQGWQVNVQSNTWMAAPVIGDDNVFVATIDDFSGKRCGITALDAKNGEKSWFYHTKGSVKNTICYAEGVVLCTDHFGVAYAINGQSGQLIWRKELGQKGLGAYIGGNVVKDGVYYTGFGNYLQALDIKNGTTIWINKDWMGGEGATSTMSIVGDILLTASNWRALYAHRINDGKLVWQKSEEGYRFRSSTVTNHRDTLVAASQKGIGFMKPENGELMEYFETPYDIQVATQPVIWEDKILMGTSHEGLVALSKKTGQEVWKVKTGEALFYSAPYSRPESATVETPPVMIDGMICFGASDGCLYLVNPDNGQVLQKVNLGAPILSGVTPIKDGFLVTDFGGNVYCFQLGE